MHIIFIIQTKAELNGASKVSEPYVPAFAMPAPDSRTQYHTELQEYLELDETEPHRDLSVDILEVTAFEDGSSCSIPSKKLEEFIDQDMEVVETHIQVCLAQICSSRLSLTKPIEDTKRRVSGSSIVSSTPSSRNSRTADLITKKFNRAIRGSRKDSIP